MDERRGQAEGASRGGAAISPHPPAGGRLGTRTALRVLGIVLLVVWGSWWCNTVRKDRLVSGHRTWVPILPQLGGDFIHNIDHPSRVWVAGGNPYQDDAMCVMFPYPPLVPLLFSWSSLVTPSAALVVWLVALAIMAGAGTWAAWKTRRELGLDEIPWSIALAAIAYSTPVLFAMERGNCDLLLVPIIILIVQLSKYRNAYAEAAAGILLAVACWTKVYPGLLVLGLLALRRWRALPGFVLAGAAIGLADVRGVQRFLANSRRMVHVFLEVKQHNGIHACEHSITELWSKLWTGTPANWLAGIPGPLAAALVLLPLIGWVSYRISRCRERSRLAYPYLLWLLAAATFVPPLASDYNLACLPLAALAVWDRRDPVVVHMIMGLLLLWWQPLHLPIGGELLFGIKMLGLAAVAVCLAGRARESDSRPDAARRRFSAAIPRPHAFAEVAR